MRARLFVYGALIAAVLLLVMVTTNPVWFAPDQTLAAHANANHLRKDVEFFSTMHPARQSRNLAALNSAADHIFSELQKAGLKPRFQTYTINQKEFKNVIATLGPATTSHVLIGAHYDVYAENPGADDNASGVAGLLELARLIAPLEKNMHHAIDLVAYTLEEPPAFATSAMGSYVHAQSLRKQGVAVEAMISIEMIGYFSDEAGSQAYPVPAFDLIYPNRGDFIALVGRISEWSQVRWMKTAFAGATDLNFKSANVPSWVPALDFSDHRNYWEAGFPAAMLTDTAFYRNKNYHEANDTPDRLDYVRMAKVVDGLQGIVLHQKIRPAICKRQNPVLRILPRWI